MSLVRDVRASGRRIPSYSGRMKRSHNCPRRSNERRTAWAFRTVDVGQNRNRVEAEGNKIEREGKMTTKAKTMSLEEARELAEVTTAIAGNLKYIEENAGA